VQVQAQGANRQEVAQVAGVSYAPTGRRRATQRANAWRWNASYLVSWRDRSAYVALPTLESAPAGRPPALSRRGWRGSGEGKNNCADATGHVKGCRRLSCAHGPACQSEEATRGRALGLHARVRLGRRSGEHGSDKSTSAPTVFTMGWTRSRTGVDLDSGLFAAASVLPLTCLCRCAALWSRIPIHMDPNGLTPDLLPAWKATTRSLHPQVNSPSQPGVTIRRTNQLPSVSGRMCS
jgi:hypothetical protein